MLWSPLFRAPRAVSAVATQGLLCAASLLAWSGCSSPPDAEVPAQCSEEGAPCNDGDACTAVDRCLGARCIGTGQTICDDGNVCTVDSCDAKVGCVHEPNPVSCDLNSACTVASCVAWTCNAVAKAAMVLELPDRFFAFETVPRPDGSVVVFRRGHWAAANLTLQHLEADGFGNVTTPAKWPAMGVPSSCVLDEQLRGTCLGSTSVPPSPDAFVGWIARLGAGGEPLWEKNYDSLLYRGFEHGAVLTDEGVVAIGRSPPFNLGTAREQHAVVAVDKHGTLPTDPSFGTVTADWIARIASGTYLVAGLVHGKCNWSRTPSWKDSPYVVCGGLKDLWVGTMGTALTPRWTRRITTQQIDQHLLGASELPGGGILLTVGGIGTLSGATQNASCDHRLFRLDGVGNTVWSGAFGEVCGIGHGSATPARIHPVSGRLDFAGAHGFLTPPVKAHLVRATPWGHTSCAEAGACAKLNLADCDDKDPCTRDDCDPKTGCIHEQWPDKTPCGTDKVCMSGDCSPKT